jgi:hypothetical protein
VDYGPAGSFAVTATIRAGVFETECTTCTQRVEELYRLFCITTTLMHSNCSLSLPASIRTFKPRTFGLQGIVEKQIL